MLKPGIYAVFASFFLCASCAYKEPVAFESENLPPMYALSKDAARGTVSLSDEARLEYVFEPPLDAAGEYSLEIDYALRFPPEGEKSLAEPLLVELGKSAWELPKELSFLGELASSTGDGILSARYAVPLDDESLGGITFRFTPARKTKKDEAPLLEIKGISLVKRRYGFTSGDEQNPPALTPFVYVRDSSLIIDPPLEYLGEGAEFRIRTDGKPASLAAGNFSAESSAASLNVPAVFFDAGSYPVSVSAEGIREALLIPGEALPAPEPIPADPGLILAWPMDAWRDPRYEVFRWEAFSSVLVFDFADYDTQDRFLKRLAFYVEKAGYRGRLVSYSEVAELHGWNAHDYSASSLANFFEAARQAALPLLEEEKELETLLLGAGVLRRGEGGEIIPGEGAIVSVSRESPDYLRSSFMVHEGYHGLYFTDGDFRDFCAARWKTFGDPGRRFLLSFFDYQQYDTKDASLVENEFMAYLLQQGVSRAGRYFGETRSNEMIRISPWRRTFLPENEEVLPSGNLFWPEIAGAFTDEAAVFSRYVNERWGLEAGRVRTVYIDR